MTTRAARSLLVETQFGSATRALLYQLNSSVFIDFLETLTGIRGLIPDPHFWGGGVHQIVRGGFLKVHTDFNRHPRLKLDRRLNLLLYLNPEWQEEWGGHLELWDRGMAKCGKRILPIFGRCVVFSTTDFSNHGHPDPLNCPEGMTRKSLALYYYSNGRPSSETAGKHYSTSFRRRPGEKPFSQQGDHRAEPAAANRDVDDQCNVAPPAGLATLGLCSGARLRSPQGRSMLAASLICRP